MRVDNPDWKRSGRPAKPSDVALSALRVHVRLDPGRARVVQEVARTLQAEDAETIRRMIDYWIAHHPSEVVAEPA